MDGYQIQTYGLLMYIKRFVNFCYDNCPRVVLGCDLGLFVLLSFKLCPLTLYKSCMVTFPDFTGRGTQQTPLHAFFSGSCPSVLLAGGITSSYERIQSPL